MFYKELMDDCDRWRDRAMAAEKHPLACPHGFVGNCEREWESL